MKLTPLDIKQKKFKKVLMGMGYNPEEVEKFLEAVSQEFERLFFEHRSMTEQVNRLNEQLKEYIENEKTLKMTLISAQQHSGNIKDNANKKADLIVREAELSAERLVESARNEVRELHKEIEKLKKDKSSLKYELMKILDYYYEALDLTQEESKSIGSGGRMSNENNKTFRSKIRKIDTVAEGSSTGN